MPSNDKVLGWTGNPGPAINSFTHQEGERTNRGRKQKPATSPQHHLPAPDSPLLSSTTPLGF